MNRDEIEALAAQVWSAGGTYIGPSIAQLTEFAALVAAKEREACAQLVEGASMRARFIRAGMNGEDIKPCTTAAAIRARGKQ